MLLFVAFNGHFIKRSETTCLSCSKIKPFIHIKHLP